MRVDTARRREADHLADKGVVLFKQFNGQAARPHDFLTVVNVLQECVDCADALFNAA